MTIEMEVQNPQDVKVTLTCTMSVAQWGMLASIMRTEALDSDCRFFGDCILDGINKVKKNVLGDPRLT